MLVLALVVAFTVAAWAAYWTGRLDGEESARADEEAAEERRSRRRHPSDRPLTGIWCIACPDRPRVTDVDAHSRLFHGSRTTGPDDDDEWLAGLR